MSDKPSLEAIIGTLIIAKSTLDQGTNDYANVANMLKIITDAREVNISDKDIMEYLDKDGGGVSLKKLIDSKKSSSNMWWIILMIVFAVVVAAIGGFFLYRRGRQSSMTNAYYY
jgi:hypothetical protein